MIVSETTFEWFVTLMVVAICVGWGTYDLVRLVKNWKRRREMRDEFFGYLIGLLVVFSGVVSLFKYHLGWWSE